MAVVLPLQSVRAGESRGIWISKAELAAVPARGAAWKSLLQAARTPIAKPALYDQKDGTDVLVMARALVWVKSGEARYRDEVLEAVREVIHTPKEPRGKTLSLGRNLIAYVIAADLVGLPPELDEMFREYLRSIRTEVMPDQHRTLVSCHEDRANNWGTHCGASRIAASIYLEDWDDVERAARVFVGWLGDREAYAGFKFGKDLSWHPDPERPVPVNPAGSTLRGKKVDGALPDEMRRGGSFRWPPAATEYPWEGLQGALAQAHLLYRVGIDTFAAQDRALLRAVRFLHEIGWEGDGDDTWQYPLIDAYYGTDFWDGKPTRPGKNVGWTCFTHGADQVDPREFRLDVPRPLGGFMDLREPS